MGAVLNGISLHGLTRSFGGTFLVFSDYMRAPVRLAALMDLPSLFIWSHDSVGVGEDGPTHQPVEHLWALRAIPNMSVARPADANETAEVWATALDRTGPTGLILSRQNLPTLDHSAGQPVAQASRGAYVIAEAQGGLPRMLLLATGSEVSVAMGARELLQAEGVPTRVVSMPCLEWFDDQPAEYRDQVLPPEVLGRVSIEAGSDQGWWKYVGSQGACVSVADFGASAAAGELFAQARVHGGVRCQHGPRGPRPGGVSFGRVSTGGCAPGRVERAPAGRRRRVAVSRQSGPALAALSPGRASARAPRRGWHRRPRQSDAPSRRPGGSCRAPPWRVWGGSPDRVLPGSRTWGSPRVSGIAASSEKLGVVSWPRAQ